MSEQRVSSRPQTGQILVSSAVPPLVAGSGIAFRDRGEYGLKVVPGELAAVPRRGLT